MRLLADKFVELRRLPAISYETIRRTLKKPTFPPEEVRRLAERFEFPYAPQHGSWLNIAEIEWSVLSRQCRDRRIGEAGVLRREIEAWQRKRKAASKTIDWQFTAAEARVKLKRLYPVIKT